MFEIKFNLTNIEDETNVFNLIGPIQCTDHINESIVESIGDRYLIKTKKKGNATYCTIMSNKNSTMMMETRLNSSDILILGDSHAHRQYYAINYAIKDKFQFRSLNLFGTHGCSYLFDFDNETRCVISRKYMQQVIVTLQPDYIFFIGHMKYETFAQKFIKNKVIKSLPNNIHDSLN